MGISRICKRVSGSAARDFPCTTRVCSLYTRHPRAVATNNPRRSSHHDKPGWQRQDFAQRKGPRRRGSCFCHHGIFAILTCWMDHSTKSGPFKAAMLSRQGCLSTGAKRTSFAAKRFRRLGALHALPPESANRTTLFNHVLDRWCLTLHHCRILSAFPAPRHALRRFCTEYPKMGCLSADVKSIRTPTSAPRGVIASV